MKLIIAKSINLNLPLASLSSFLYVFFTISLIKTKKNCNGLDIQNKYTTSISAIIFNVLGVLYINPDSSIII